MNLHGIVSGAIDAVNPRVDVTLLVSDGYDISDSGRQIPKYKSPKKVKAQVQSLSAKDLRQVDFLNLQNIQNTIYLNGDVNGVVRPDGKGGDLIVMEDGSSFLVAAVLEQWPDWVKVAVTLQNNS